MADPPPPSTTQVHPAIISPLEQEVLDEYASLLNNLNKVRDPHLQSLFPPGLLSISRLVRSKKKAPSKLILMCAGQLSNNLSSLADRPASEMLDGLRLLERKTSLVCTLLKASVYSIVLQQQIYGGEEAEGGQQERGP